MKRRAEHEPGFVLHAYPYKETSLIVEAFTRRYGRVGLLARGGRPSALICAACARFPSAET